MSSFHDTSAPAPFSVTAKNGDVYSRHPAGPWVRNGVATIGDRRWVALLDALEEAASEESASSGSRRTLGG